MKSAYVKYDLMVIQLSAYAFNSYEIAIKVYKECMKKEHRY